MKALFWIFVGMFAYGAFTGLWGAGLIALFMAGFILYACRQQERDWARDPRYASKPPCTLAELARAEQESS